MLNLDTNVRSWSGSVDVMVVVLVVCALLFYVHLETV